MADISSLSLNAPARMWVLKDDENVQGIDLNTRAADATRAWTPSEVPDGAIALSVDGSFVWFLFSDHIEKWTSATKSRVAGDVNVVLDSNDGTPSDLAAKGDWLFVTYTDSLKVTAHKKTIDTRTVRRSGGRRVGLPGLGTRAPISLHRFLDGYFVTAPTGTNLNYYYVTKTGVVQRSTFVSAFLTSNTPQTRTDRVDTGRTRPQSYIIGTRQVTEGLGTYRRGSLVSSASTSRTDYTSSSAARSAARGLLSTYTGSSYERVDSATSRQSGTTTQRTFVRTLTTSALSTRSAAQTALNTLKSSYSTATYEFSGETISTSQSSVPGSNVFVTDRETSSTYSTASAARTAANSLRTSLLSTYPTATHTMTVSTTSEQVSSGGRTATRTLGTYNGPWRSTPDLALADDASVRATARSSTSGANRSYRAYTSRRSNRRTLYTRWIATNNLTYVNQLRDALLNSNNCGTSGTTCTSHLESRSTTLVSGGRAYRYRVVVSPPSDYRRNVVVTQTYQTGGTTSTVYKGVVRVERKTTRQVTRYTGSVSVYRKAAAARTLWTGHLSVYNRIENTRTRTVIDRGTRQVPVFENRVTNWTEYDRRITKFFPVSQRLVKLEQVLESSSLSTEGNFDLDVRLSRGLAISLGANLNTSRFNSLAAGTTVRNYEILTNRAGLLGEAFINRFSSLSYLANLALGPNNKGILFVPSVTATGSAQSAAEMRVYEVDFSTSTINELTDFRDHYRLFPTNLASVNLLDYQDVCWEGTDSTAWKNLCIRRGNNAVRLTDIDPRTTRQTVLSSTPAAGVLQDGSGFSFESSTDWAAGVGGGVWITGTSTSQVSERAKKDAYTHATNKYKWIDYCGDDIVAMRADGTIDFFTESNGVMTLTTTINKDWLPSSLQATSLQGVTCAPDYAYAGYNNPDQILAIRRDTGDYTRTRNIPQSVIDPASVPRYTFNVLDKTIEATGRAHELTLELANGGVGTFTYLMVSSESAHISINFENNVLKLIVDSRIARGNYNVIIRATPAEGQSLGGPLTDTMTLRVRPRGLFSIQQQNIRYDTLLGEVTLDLPPWSLRNVGLDSVPGRYLATKLTWVSSSGDDAASEDWEYKGNDITLADWFKNREFVMKPTLPVGTHRFKYEVLENLDTESYTETDDFEPVGTSDASVEFNVVVVASPEGSPIDPIFAPSDILHQKQSGDASFILARAFGGTNVFTYSVANLPTGVTFDAATRRLSVDDTAVLVGEYDIPYTYQQRNSGNDADIGDPVTRSFKLVITTLSDVTINQKDVIFAPSLGPRRIQLASPVGGTGRYRLSLDGLPEGITFADSPPSIFLPDTVGVGVYSINYRVQPIDNLGNARGPVVSDAFDIQVIAFDIKNVSNYSYAALYKWIDGNGLEHLSGVDLKNVRLVGKIGEFYQGAQIGVNVTVDKIRTTDKVPVFVEIYRTEANLSSRKLVTQVSFLDREQSIRFTDTVPDSVIASKGIVYVNDTRDSNVQPEGATTMQVFANHLAIAGMAGDKRRVLISNQFRFEYLRPVEFDGVTGFVLPEDILALKRIDNNCIIFTISRIFFLNVLNFTRSLPAEIQTSHGIVPDSKNAIVRLRDGLLFKSQNGIYLLTRSMTLEYVGKAVEQFNKDVCLKAALSNKKKEVYFLLASGKILIFNLDFQRWSIIDANGVEDISVFRGDLVLLKNGRLLSFDTPNFSLGRSGQPLRTHLKRVVIETQWIQVSQINGFSLLRELVLLGNYNQLSNAKVTVHYDFDDSDFDTYYLDLSARSSSERVRIQLKRYKCSAFKVRIEARTRKPCSFSGFTIEYAVDPQAALGTAGAIGGAES